MAFGRLASGFICFGGGDKVNVCIAELSFAPQNYVNRDCDKLFSYLISHRV